MRLFTPAQRAHILQSGDPMLLGILRRHMLIGRQQYVASVVVAASDRKDWPTVLRGSRLLARINAQLESMA